MKDILPLDLVARGRALYRECLKDVVKARLVTGDADVGRVEDRVVLPVGYPGRSIFLSFGVGEESAFRSCIYTDGSKSGKGTGATWVAYYDGEEVETKT